MFATVASFFLLTEMVASVFKGHGLKKLVFTTSLLIQIKAFIGTFRHKIRGRF